METFKLLANPWWVNFFALVPFIVYFWWHNKLEISKIKLFYTGIFGIAFGFVEAALVVYLRSAIGFLSMKNGMLLNVINFQNFYQNKILEKLPSSLFAIEIYREAATIVMLLAVAALAANNFRNRLAVFLWTFAWWDIFYYVGLWLTIRWPASLLDSDILFLIPAPWISQVWFPILVSFLLLFSVFLGIRKISDQPKI